MPQSPSGAINRGNYLAIVFKGALASQLEAKIEDFTVVKVPAPPLPFTPLSRLALTALTLKRYSTT